MVAALEPRTPVRLGAFQKPALRRADIQATLSGTASVKGTLMAPQVAADITIDEALVNLNRLTGSSVTTLPVEGTSEAPEPVTEKKEGHGSLDVSVRAPGHIAVNGRRSPQSLYDFNLATYDEGDTFDQSTAKGFVHVHGLSSKIAARRDLGPN